MLAYLQVHVFTVNVVAPYTDIYMKKWRQISSTSLPERHVRVPKQSYIDFRDNFILGELVCIYMRCPVFLNVLSGNPTRGPA